MPRCRIRRAGVRRYQTRQALFEDVGRVVAQRRRDHRRGVHAFDAADGALNGGGRQRRQAVPGSRRLLGYGEGHVRVHVPPSVRVAQVSAANMVRRACTAGTKLFPSIPFTVLMMFTFNVLLVEFEAADFSGTGASLGTVNQTGPKVTVLVVAGAGARSMCPDLGARTIREELDALRVMGMNPIQTLVVPLVLAATNVALLLASAVILVRLAGGFFASVCFQHVTPGAFVAGMTLITGVSDVLVALVKATLFGLTAGLIACYMGTSVGGGPAGVGNAVNETVEFSSVAVRHQCHRDRRGLPGDTTRGLRSGAGCAAVLGSGRRHRLHQPATRTTRRVLVRARQRRLPHFVRNTRSGGVARNDFAAQMIPSAAPFGGVGRSGTGAYHGKAWFRRVQPLPHRGGHRSAVHHHRAGGPAVQWFDASRFAPRLADRAQPHPPPTHALPLIACSRAQR